jgi:hypothetical protein
MQELRMMVQRAESYFANDRPAYWRQQTTLAERDLNEAKENLARKLAVARPGDRPAATEARQRVRKAQARLDQCQAKQREARKWALEIAQQCDGVLGPLADVVEHCEVLLPAAARELQTLIDQLRRYADQPQGNRGD